jgi:hypothetical protein
MYKKYGIIYYLINTIKKLSAKTNSRLKQNQINKFLLRIKRGFGGLGGG